MTAAELLCNLLGHHPRVVQIFSADSRKILCTRCGGYFAMNDTLRLFLPWCDEFEDLYANTLGHGRTIK